MTDMIPEGPIAEGRRLLEAASSGPWDCSVEDGDEFYFHGNQARITVGDDTVMVTGCDENSPDAALIVWLRNNIAELIDELDRLRSDSAASCDVDSCGEPANLAQTWRFAGLRIVVDLCDRHFDMLDDESAAYEAAHRPEPVCPTCEGERNPL